MIFSCEFCGRRRGSRRRKRSKGLVVVMVRVGGYVIEVD